MGVRSKRNQVDSRPGATPYEPHDETRVTQLDVPEGGANAKIVVSPSRMECDHRADITMNLVCQGGREAEEALILLSLGN